MQSVYVVSLSFITYIILSSCLQDMQVCDILHHGHQFKHVDLQNIFLSCDMILRSLAAWVQIQSGQTEQETTLFDPGTVIVCLL